MNLGFIAGAVVWGLIIGFGVVIASLDYTPNSFYWHLGIFSLANLSGFSAALFAGHTVNEWDRKAGRYKWENE